MADENRDEALELRPLTEDEADECSFYVDPLPDGLSLTQHKYYRWGDTAIIAVGELNYPNHWDDEDFEHTCNAVETALAATRPAPKADTGATRESESLCNNGPSVDVMIGGKWRAIDKDIAPIVAALNQVGCTTVASCSGHGHRPGNIALADGREIVIARNFEEGRRIDRLFPIGANGEPAPKADSALVGELRDSPEYTLVLNVDTGEKGDSHVRISTDLRDRILAALSDRDVVLEEAAKVAWSDIDTAPKDGSWVILAKHGWTTDMGDLKQGSEEWKARFFDDRAPKKHRCWWVTRGYWKADRQKWTDGLDYLTEPTHWMPDFALPPVCEVPPDGWACTRKLGHDGPCAAVPAHLKERV